MNDIYMGVDVWGRGSPGGGGFGSYIAISLISPECLGLSVALFGQAWTWESEQDNPGWTWEKWWAYESKLWVGPIISRMAEVSEAPQDESKPLDASYRPIASFFPRYPPPEPSQLSFHTTFCPGSGTAWFVEGVKVFQIESGWTDVDKQTSVGDMLWPCPKLYWNGSDRGVRGYEIPEALSRFCMDDAWNGGNSIQISISCSGFRDLWLPIQSLRLIPERSYEAHAIYKLEYNHGQDLETEFAISFKPLPGSQDDFDLNIVSASSTKLTGGWTKLTIQFNLSGDCDKDELQLSAAIGLVIVIASENPTDPLQLSFLLGQLNVRPHVPSTFTEEVPLVLWTDFTPTPASNLLTVPLSGTLSWEVATSFPNIEQIVIKPPDDPHPAWNPQPTIDWFPSFLYFNIYAQLFTDNIIVKPPPDDIYAQPFSDYRDMGTTDKAIWIGTSGLNGQYYCFDVLQQNLPFNLGRGFGVLLGNSPFVVTPTKKIRFYIQGMYNSGEVLKWQECGYVDVFAK